MTTLSNIIAFAFDLIMVPFKGFDPMWSMLVISAFTGVLMLVIYKYCSNQAEIKKVKDRIKAHFLAIILYKDSFGVLVRSVKDIIWANFRYMGLNVLPLLFMIVPVGLLLIQMNFWYGYKSLEPGERFLVKATLVKHVNLEKAQVSLIVPEGLEIQSPPLRIPTISEVSWLLAARQKGNYDIKVCIDDREVTKKVVVSDNMERLALLRHASGFWDSLLYPGETAIPSASLISSVQVCYGPSLMNIFGHEIHWIIVYLVLSIFFGLALKGVFKVQI
jgi:hypothetical protein